MTPPRACGAPAETAAAIPLALLLAIATPCCTTVCAAPFIAVKACGEKKGVRSAQRTQVGPRVPVGIQLPKAGVGPTSGPTWHRSRLRDRGEAAVVAAAMLLPIRAFVRALLVPLVVAHEVPGRKN